MAITIQILYCGKHGNAKKFAEEMMQSGVVDAIRAEKGNLRYAYFLPFEGGKSAEDYVLLIDSWENQQALDFHHASPVMAKITSLREKYNLTMQVERFVTDENGFSEHDKKFIRN
jgi:quinol monooxygenase YgiN